MKSIGCGSGIPKSTSSFFRRQRIEICKSSETRVAEVSRPSESSSRGERTFEVRRRRRPSENLGVALLHAPLLALMFCFEFYLKAFVKFLFSRADLRKAVSGAKFDAESDSEVRLAIAPPKSIKNDETLISETKKKIIFFFSFLMFLVPPTVVQGSNFNNT